MITAMQYFCFLLGLAFFLITNIIGQDNYTLLFSSVLLMWLNNMLFSVKCMRQRFIFFFANLTFYVFLLGRMSVAFIGGDDFVKSVTFSASADVWKGLVLLFIALMFMFTGALLYTLKFYCLNEKEYITIHYWNTHHDFVSSVRFVSLIIYSAALLCECLVGYEKMQFNQSHTYFEYYIYYTRNLPFFIYGIASFEKYCLCLYLATLPTKRYATIALFAHFFVALPDLLIGARSSVVTALFLILIYYMARGYYCRKGDIWFGKNEKTCLLVMSPFLLIFLAAYGYIRTNVSWREFNIFELFMEFFYSQGVSFGWLCSGLGITEMLSENVCSYTFGGVIDYYRYGTMAQLLWGGTDLGVGNNILRATLSNSMGHHLSYLLLGDLYLEGSGVGSSYILEVFVDFGYIGVAIFCLLLGYITIYIVHWALKGIIQYYIFLVSINGILLMPRSSAMAPVLFLFQAQYICLFILCVGYSYILSSFIVHSHNIVLHKKMRQNVM